MTATPSWAGKHLHPTALALALSLVILSAASAQTSNFPTLEPVFVTATRFAEPSAEVPIGATVIDAEQIRRAGISNVNEAVRKLGGVYGRQNLNGLSDYELDLRGFGASSSQNLVILVDGVRLSENELVPAVLSSLPVESVERIEILRGGASVLYGEGATGGVINIISKSGRGLRSGGTVVAEVGSFNQRSLRASATRSEEGFALDAHIGGERTDNYRDNNTVRQKNFSGGAEWRSTAGRLGVRIEAARQDARLPGALDLDQFNSNPRQTLTPNDVGSLDTERYTLFGERSIGAFEVAAELSHRERSSSFESLPNSTYAADSRVTQFSPRLRYRSNSANWQNDLVLGADFGRWRRHTNGSFGGSPSAAGKASQRAEALYLRDEIRAGGTRVAAGVRREWFDKDFTDPLGFGSTAYDKEHHLHAWELEASHAFAQKVEVFAKAGRSYRVANVDENAFTPVPNQALEPQTSHDLEAGFALGDANRKVTARVFQHRLKNEIFYDALVFQNVNLDPTRRRGFELEALARLTPRLDISARWQHVSAQFTGGPYDGSTVPLVPRNNVWLRANWQPRDGHNAQVGVQWTDAQRYGGDVDNSCSAKVPAFATLDARYAVRAGRWEFAVVGSNLTDKDYFTNAFGSCRSGIYPDPGRQLKLSARMDF